MNFLDWAKKELGIDIQKEKYAYGVDEQFGFMSQSKIPDKWVKTTCGYCSVGCGMHLGVKDGVAISVRGDESHPVNEGRLCPKGLCEHEAITAPNRALHPLLKVGGKFQRIAWDSAIQTMTDKFKGIQERYGPDALGVVGTGQLVTEEFYALGKLVRLGFKTKNYDSNTTLCMASAVSGYKRSFGSDGPPGSYEDLEKADAVFLIGANIADNHPILCYRLEKNMKKVMVVVDPRLSKTAMMADLYLSLKPRTDIALFNGMMHVLIQENLVDQDYISKNTKGFEELKEHLKDYTPAKVSRITGLSITKIELVARLYGRAQAPFIAWTMGVNHSTQGAETVSAICNLALLTGKVGKVGASPFSITGQCNAMGSREASFTSAMPGYRKFESLKDREDIAHLWKVPTEEIPDERGMAYPDIIEGILSRKIKGLWIIATNPLVSYPNQDYLRQALSELEFLVVQDAYYPIPTSEIADLVLPAAVWGEKEGTYTNSERRVSKVNAAVKAPGEAKSDFQIFMDIGLALQVSDKIFPNWTEPRDAFDEWKTVSRGRLCDYSGMTYESLSEHGGIQWPFPDASQNKLLKRSRNPKESIRLYADGQYPTEDKKAQLFKVGWLAPSETPDEEYPFWLNTGRTVEHWHTRTKTGQISILQKLSPEAWVDFNARDARRLNLKHGDYVRVASRRGEIERIILRVTETVAPGQIFIPFHFAEANANNLTLNEFCPISREPNYKQCAVKIEKAMPVPLLKKRGIFS